MVVFDCLNIIQTVTEKTGPGIFVIKSKLIEQHRQNFRKMIFNLWNNFCKKMVPICQTVFIRHGILFCLSFHMKAYLKNIAQFGLQTLISVLQLTMPQSQRGFFMNGSYYDVTATMSTLAVSQIGLEVNQPQCFSTFRTMVWTGGV